MCKPSSRIDLDWIDYFKKLAEETSIPYQNLMNHYLADCASKGLRPSLVWQWKVAATVAGKIESNHTNRPIP